MFSPTAASGSRKRILATLTTLSVLLTQTAVAHAQNYHADEVRQNLAAEATNPMGQPDVARIPAAQDAVSQFIVYFADDSVEAQDAALDTAGAITGVGKPSVGRETATGGYIVTLPRAVEMSRARGFLQQLGQDSAIEAAEVDGMNYAFSMPNDPLYPDQWGLHGGTSINADLAWDQAAPSGTGAGQTVAVIDSGITAHPELDPNVVPGYDFVSDANYSNDGDGRDTDPSDPGDFTVADQCGTGYSATNSSWHGTMVSGIIAAESNNALGMSGVAPDARIQPIRAMGPCGGITSDITDAIVWASGGKLRGVPVNQTPASVINLSLGGPGECSYAYQRAIDIAVANGSTVVAAAGNEGIDAVDTSPANCNNAITVAATDKNMSQTYYSNYGSVVDISAPGGDYYSGLILATGNSGATSPADPVMTRFAGTSAAAPFVSGAAAVLKSIDPSLTPQDVSDLLLTSAQPMTTDQCGGGCGTGLVDLSEAVYQLTGVAPQTETLTTTTTPTSSTVEPTSSAEATTSVTGSTTPTSINSSTTAEPSSSTVETTSESTTLTATATDNAPTSTETTTPVEPTPTTSAAVSSPSSTTTETVTATAVSSTTAEPTPTTSVVMPTAPTSTPVVTTEPITTVTPIPVVSSTTPTTTSSAPSVATTTTTVVVSPTTSAPQVSPTPTSTVSMPTSPTTSVSPVVTVTPVPVATSSSTVPSTTKVTSAPATATKTSTSSAVVVTTTPTTKVTSTAVESTSHSSVPASTVTPITVTQDVANSGSSTSWWWLLLLLFPIAGLVGWGLTTYLK